MLSKAEAAKWSGTTVTYDPLQVHLTVPLLLFENQRLDTRIKTLAASGGRPKFTATGLGKHGRKPPFELKLPKIDEDTGLATMPAWRSDVQLPVREDPWTVPVVSLQDRAALEGVERSHFWLYVCASTINMARLTLLIGPIGL